LASHQHSEHENVRPECLSCERLSDAQKMASARGLLRPLISQPGQGGAGRGPGARHRRAQVGPSCQSMNCSVLVLFGVSPTFSDLIEIALLNFTGASTPPRLGYLRTLVSIDTHSSARPMAALLSSFRGYLRKFSPGYRRVYGSTPSVGASPCAECRFASKAFGTFYDPEREEE
jgi:hypothetical protein